MAPPVIALPPTAFADALPDGSISKPSLDLASSPQGLTALALSLAQTMSGACGWAQPADTSIIEGELSASANANPLFSSSRYQLALFDLPPNPYQGPNGTNGQDPSPFQWVDLWVLVDSIASNASITLKAVQNGGQLAGANGSNNFQNGQNGDGSQTLGTLSTTAGWFNVQVRLATGTVAIIADGSVGSSPLVIGSMAIFSGTLASQGLTPATFQPRSLTDIQNNRPDSVSLTAAINNTLLFPALRGRQLWHRVSDDGSHGRTGDLQRGDSDSDAGAGGAQLRPHLGPELRMADERDAVLGRAAAPVPERGRRGVQLGTESAHDHAQQHRDEQLVLRQRVDHEWLAQHRVVDLHAN
jgi:hypothetical protein